MRFLFSAMVLVLLLPACAGKREGGARGNKTTQGPEVEKPEISVVAFHRDDTTSVVYVRIENQNLLYKRPDTSTVFYGHLQVHCQLLLDGNSRKVTDSATAELHDRAGVENVNLRALFSSFPLDARFGNDYLLLVDVTDMNRRSRYRKELRVNKSSRLTAQNFLLSRSDSVLFRNHFQPGEGVTVRYADTTVRELHAEAFYKEFAAAPPPFSTRDADPLKYKPDSVFKLRKAGSGFPLVMPGSGFYHLRAEQDLPAGITLYSFGSTFPGVAGSEEMIAAARYIMSREEFDRCINASDQKKAIDDFWLNIGGSNERARELLKRYYSRVQEANKQFSSFTQGWKTDRGMIFIVFGRPVNVYKTRKDEIWVYGNEANPATLRFVFNKTENPYSENDFVMERSQFYKEPWHRAVDFWRQGHVYLERMR